MDNNLRLAKEIMSHVGGVGNIASLNHCSTRLRLRVNHEENFDVEAIKKIDGVLDVVKAIGGFQIIVGNNVSKVYAAIVANYDVKVGEEGGRVAGNVFGVVLNVLSDIMGPAIPAIVAAGLFSALATIGKLLGLAEESTTYQIIYSVSQAPLYRAGRCAELSKLYRAGGGRNSDHAVRLAGYGCQLRVFANPDDPDVLGNVLCQSVY